MEMNIQARKLLLIEEFLRVSDENIITKLEAYIKHEKKRAQERNIKPMLINEFHEMIDHAIMDIDAGRVISHKGLKEKVKTWK